MLKTVLTNEQVLTLNNMMIPMRGITKLPDDYYGLVIYNSSSCAYFSTSHYNLKLDKSPYLSPVDFFKVVACLHDLDPSDYLILEIMKIK